MKRQPEDIVGKRFGPENQLVVTEIVRKSSMKDSLFKAHCEICVQDKELNGDATYIVSIHTIDKGTRPCSCSPKHNYSKEQYEILLERECKSKPYSFVGFVGEYKMGQSFINLQCKKHGDVWQKYLSNFWMGAGCPSCRAENVGKLFLADEKESIEVMRETGMFADGAKFRRTTNPDESTTTWYMWCPLCSVGDQEFKSCLQSLKNGARPCNCYVEGGFNKLEPATFYVIRAVSEDTEFTGYGISNTVKNRMYKHRMNLRKHGFSITEMELFEMTGQQAFDTELYIKRNFPTFSQVVDGFKKEATYYWLYDDIIKYAEGLEYPE